MNRAHLLLCIASATAGGFVHYAAALRWLYEREHGPSLRAFAPSRETFRWSTVTGTDFGRSIAWAKAQPPGPLSSVALRGHVAAHHARQAVPSPCSQ
jgi:hypothetical protein